MNEKNEIIDILEKKIKENLKNKGLSKKTIKMMIKYSKKELILKQIENIEKVINKYSEEYYKNRWMFLREKVFIYGNIGIRKIFKNASRGLKRLKDINILNYYKDLYENDLLFKINCINKNYLKIIGLNKNVYRYKDVKNYLKYLKLKLLDVDGATTNK